MAICTLAASSIFHVLQYIKFIVMIDYGLNGSNGGYGPNKRINIFSFTNLNSKLTQMLRGILNCIMSLVESRNHIYAGDRGSNLGHPTYSG
jgi:hypothetical protein